MSQLSDLVKVALLGTQREQLPEISPGEPLAPLWAQLEKNDPAYDLLSMAGAISLYEQVGQHPLRIKATASQPLAPKTDLPRCSVETKRRLATILDTNFQDLLPEFLTALVDTGQRVPEEHLPALLERGAKVSSLRPLILPVLGHTGRWLASQNPAWDYAAPDLDTWDGLISRWRNGRPGARQSLLRQIRHIDPERGRQLLESTWRSEASAARVLFIKTMDTGLSMADEPFLETALDDRSQTVRRKAAELLAHLPESRLCRRMISHTSQIFRWVSQGNPQILIHFPPEIGPQLRRDGVNIPALKNPARIRTMQTVEMLGAIPLDHWTTTWQASAEELVRAALNSQSAQSLLRGFTHAALRQRHATWGKALLTRDNFGLNTIRLISILPAEVFQALVIDLAKKEQPLNRDSLLLKVLQKWTHPVSDAVAGLWLRYITRIIAHGGGTNASDMALRTHLKHFARACPPHLMDEVAQALLPQARVREGWQPIVDDIVATLKFRQAMLAEIYRARSSYISLCPSERGTSEESP